jgi:hypothetical protein
MRPLIVLLLIGLSVVAVSPSEGARSSQISLTEDQKFPLFLSIAIVAIKGGSRAYCSGYEYSWREYVTAAHCLDLAKQGFLLHVVRVGPGEDADDVMVNDKTGRVLKLDNARLVQHGRYRTLPDGRTEYDIGMVFTNEYLREQEYDVWPNGTIYEYENSVVSSFRLIC